AAANVYLDALAQHRRVNGLPATAIAFGLWDVGAGMALGLGEVDRRRMAVQGLPVLDHDAGLVLFGRALDVARPAVAALRVDRAALRARTDDVPALLRGVVSAGRRAAAAGGVSLVEGFAGGLVGLTAGERYRLLVQLVREQAAVVLGHDTVAAIEADRAFSELGFDSLAATDLRNKLNQRTGLRLPATLIFDHPSADRIARHLADRLAPAGAAAGPTIRTTALDQQEPIAIVGMACRYPGGVTGPEGLWRLLMAGGDAISDFPGDRGWDFDTLRDPNAEDTDALYSRGGGFVDGAGDFDPGLFGISPREAEHLDPQQRLTVETAWEALEVAGIDPTSLHGSRTGVFTGVMYHDYPGSDGNGSAVAGRVAYRLGLEGPAVSVDTACSSSLVALHLAVQAIRQGECDLALAGGVTVLASPAVFIGFGRQGGLSADGTCKSFASAADGTGFSEGVGMLAVEPLSEAHRRGHRVLAVVRGSAVNSDGASNGLTAPNGPAQERVIRQALAVAQVDAEQVDVIEAHGTGTTLGDPIEAQALLATYGQDRERPVLLGSVKSNLGHTQAAAGVAGVIKMVLAMRHGELPKTLHVDEPSWHVDWTAGSAELLTDTRPWPETGRPRRAGVSSFGISGTNAHVILEQAPPAPAAEAGTHPDPGPVPWLVSGADRPALRAQAERLIAHLEANPELRPLDVAFSLATGRAALDHRAVVVGTDLADLTGLLGGIARGDSGDQAASRAPLAFVFAGQGSQRLGMGRELSERFPVFAAAFDEISTRLDVREVVWGDDAEALDQTAYAQASLFAFEVALFRLLESWDVRPDFVGGHSIGEIAAAHVAGVLSLDDACALVAARGRLMQALPRGGAMVAIAATEDQVTPLLSDGVSIAAVNGPSSVVISGVEDAVLAIAAQFAKTSRLRVSHAFHSPLMDPMLDDFAAVVAGLSFAEPTIPVIAAGDVTSADYWVRHVRDAVRFADTVAAMTRQGVDRFLEIGPSGVLAGMVPFTAPDALAVASCRKDRAEVAALTTAIGRLSVAGVTLDWPAFFAGTGARTVDLPTYAFQHRRFWLNSAADRHSSDHPLQDLAVELADAGGVVVTGHVSVRSQPWLADHVILGRMLMPGTAFVELAIHAGDHVGCGYLEELTLAAPLVLSDAGDVQIQVAVGVADDAGRRSVTVHTRPGDNGEWTRHASGLMSERTPAPGGTRPQTWPPAGAEPITTDGAYATFADIGFAYGPAFQGLRSAWRYGDDIYAEIVLPEASRPDAARFGIHPALLDATMHAGLLGSGHGEFGGNTPVPFSWSGVALHAAGASAVRVRLTRTTDDDLAIDVTDTDGQPVLSVAAMTTRPMAADQFGTAGHTGSLFEITWRPVSSSGRPAEVLDCAGLDVRSVLAALQSWSSDEKLVVVTHRAVAVDADDDVDLV
ncbi:MAG: hypothetical protein QOC94_1171, partial [Actinoplanes sp.]|nr:hypothetical protein [Actinoplanes sp.]